MNKKKSNNPQRRAVIAVICFVVLIAAIVLMIILHGKVQSGEVVIPIIQSTEQPLQETTEVPVITSPRDQEIDWQDSNDDEEIVPTATGTYANERVLECRLNKNYSLSIGLNDTSSSINGIVLNPVVTADHEIGTEVYAYRIFPSRGSIAYTGTPQAFSSDQNKNENNFYICGRTYDKLVHASYKDDINFGIYWFNDLTMYQNDKDGAEILIHCIRIDDGTLVGAAKVSISYDGNMEGICDAGATGTYHLTSITTADVSARKELPDSIREPAIMGAISFINTGSENYLNLNFTETDYANWKDYIVVERIDRVFFNRFLSTKDEVIAAGKFVNCAIYAVNVPVPYYGCVTVYLSPDYQVKTVLDEIDYMVDGTSLAIIGYDVPVCTSVNAFNSYLLPEDAAKFNIN